VLDISNSYVENRSKIKPDMYIQTAKMNKTHKVYVVDNKTYK